MVERRAIQSSLPCLADRVFLGVRADISRTLDGGEAGMTLLANDTEVRQDVVEPPVEGDLDRMKRHTLPFGGTLEAAYQVAAKRAKYVLHRARRIVRFPHAGLGPNIERLP